jgi:hypothetical protein
LNSFLHAAQEGITLQAELGCVSVSFKRATQAKTSVESFGHLLVAVVMGFEGCYECAAYLFSRSTLPKPIQNARAIIPLIKNRTTS